MVLCIAIQRVESNQMKTAIDEIAITLDVDWACEEILEYCLNLLLDYGFKATIFATHASDILSNLNPRNFEVGIHPNFKCARDCDKKIDELLEIYPNAIGIRSHELLQSTKVFSTFIKKGLKYDSSTYIPLQENLAPWNRLKELTCIPIYWFDDTQFYIDQLFSFDNLHCLTNGLKVYGFHPIHVYVNTASLMHYKKFKKYYHHPSKLLSFRNEGAGIYDYFIDLLEYLKRRRLKTKLLREIYLEWLELQKIDT